MEREGEIGGKAKHKDQKKNTQPIPDAQFTFARNKAFKQSSQIKSNQIKSCDIKSNQIDPRLPQATVGPRSVVCVSSPENRYRRGGEKYPMVDGRW
jgi:hypothetical protein